MSVASIAGKLSIAAVVAGAGTQTVPEVAPETSIWTIPVLGIPMLILVASLCASAMRNFREAAAPDRALLRKTRITVFDGFIAGWLVVALAFALSIWKGIVLPMGTSAAVAALIALLLQFIRDHGKGYWDRIFDTLLDRIARKRAGGES